MKRTAALSDCGTYRYSLTREWSDGPRALFVMLNPSVADHEMDDPTIRRAISFAKREHCGSLEVVNLFALRATNPAELAQHPAPIGPLNERAILDAVERAAVIVVAWGSHPLAMRRALLLPRHVLERSVCLGKTKGGAPRHPLYVRADAPLVPLCLEPAR